MTIPTLRGLTEETSNLPGLGKAISDILAGGDATIQKALRAAIIQDPSVAENLSQLSRDNPELYGALKLGKFGNEIAKTPEGYKQKREAQTLQAGQLDIQNKQEESDLAPVRRSILNAQKTKLDLDIQDSLEASKGFPGINFKKAVDDFTSGTQSPDLQAVMSNPKAMPMFTQMVGFKKQGEMLASQEKRADERINAQFDLQANREDKKREKDYVDKGNEFFKKYGVGTPQTWAEYLMNPSIQQTVDDLVKNPKLAGKDPHLLALRDIGTRLEQDQNLHGLTERARITGQVNGMLKDLRSKKVKGEEQKGIMANLNSQLEVLEQLGGRSMRMVPESSLATGSTMDWLTQKKYSDKPILVDAITKQPLDENKIDVISEQPVSKQYSPQQINQTAAAIAPYKGKITWNDVIEKLKKEQPEMYKILKQRGDIPN